MATNVSLKVSFCLLNYQHGIGSMNSEVSISQDFVQHYN
uniref:Uncharacterized protein n=1 Tax=Arundo donax TaxID=35708 RepID=A0A0A8ZI81_ARUDO